MITAVAVAGVLIGCLQGVTLFILSDLRDRVMRLETREMAPIPSLSYRG